MRPVHSTSFLVLLIACAARSLGRDPRPSRSGRRPWRPRLPPPTGPVTPAAPQRHDVDDSVGPASFAASAGWWVTDGASVLVLEDPDRQLKVLLIETPEPDLLRAIDAAWQRVKPGFARKPLHEPDSPPPIRGGEAMTSVEYETKTSEHRSVSADARRYGGTTYVALVDSDRGARDRRSAQLEAELWTLQRRGMHEESFTGKTPRPIDETRAKELDAFIERARIKLDIPGAAVAIIEGGKVVYERGFGVRALGHKESVTPNTLFPMASIGKSMTTMMEATLVDAGTLRWDTPVAQLLPGFALADPDVTSRLLLWHMSCACTGMPWRDLEGQFEYGHVTPEQRIASLKTFTPTTAVGETFQYSNQMVAAGGYAAAHAYDPRRPLNDAYDEVMRAKVFGPIGMTSTTLDPANVRRSDHAMPHGGSVGDDVAHALPLALEDDVTPIRPAGGAWSNLRDMERYVMTEIARGSRQRAGGWSRRRTCSSGAGCASARESWRATGSASGWARCATSPIWATRGRGTASPR